MSKSKVLLRRVIAFAGAVIITINIAAAPQRARAVAVTASVVASVAAILTACGVSYWASSQQDVIEYLGGKIDDYLGSLEVVPESYEDWLGIDAASQLFEVTANGAMRFGNRVANEILDFCQWFKTEDLDDVSSVLRAGGTSSQFWSSLTADDLTNPRTLVLDDGSVLLSAESVKGFSTSWSQYIGFTAPVGDSYHCTVTCESVSHSGLKFQVTARRAGADSSAVSGPYSYYSLTAGASTSAYVNPGYEIFVQVSGDNENIIYDNFSAVFSFAHNDEPVLLTPATNEITKQDVYIPSAPADGVSDFYVAPSVSLYPSMSVDTAAERIYDGVTSEDGLTSEVGSAEAEGGALEGWGWLSDILQRIERAISGTQEQTAPAQYEAIDDYTLDLTSFFPFCLPWDIHRGLSLLVAEPVAPSINWTVPLPGGGTYTLALDLSEWDGVAQVARTMELLAFVVALAVATKKLIKW